MKAYVEAYGCTLNFGESKEIEEALSAKGWELTDSPDTADLIVLSTCVVIEKTERAMLDRVRQLAGAPRFIVTGCMAATSSDRVRELAPRAEFVPPGDIETLSSLIEAAGPSLPFLRPVDSFSIVPIATGCMGECAYCMTRLARGQLRSRSIEQITSSVEKAVGLGGSQEIRITAQDTASYGIDVGTDLPSLMKSICTVTGDFKVRIGMMNPRSAIPISEEIAAMYKEKKVFKFLHLPVQSGSDEILSRMDRGHTAEEFLRLVGRVRSEAADLSLSTDLIVGYPGETDEDHEASMELIRTAYPDIVNVTKFSPRPGTKAESLPGKVTGRITKERSRQLTRLRFEIALDVNRRWIGKEARCLATERGKGRSTILRTDEYRQVVIKEELPLGRYHHVVIDDATSTYLVGKVKV